MKPRVISNCLLFCGFFLTPWWLGVFLIVAAAFVFKGGPEIILYGICYDAIFGMGPSSFSLYGSVFAVVLYCSGVFLAKRIA